MMSIRSVAVAVLFLAAAASAQATEIFGDFVKLNGNLWTAEFKVVNTGTLAEISNFTIFFDPSEASHLQLIAAPQVWDTIVIDPDVALVSDGFMDALAIDPAQSLRPGQTTGLFKVQFEWLSTANPPVSLRFGIYDASFNELEAGRTTPGTAGPIPEPGTWLLLVGGLAAVCGARNWQSRSPTRG